MVSVNNLKHLLVFCHIVLNVDVCKHFLWCWQDTPEEHETTSTENVDDTNHDPHFEPIVSLPVQDVKTLEEDEEEIFKMQVDSTGLFGIIGHFASHPLINLL